MLRRIIFSGHATLVSVLACGFGKSAKFDTICRLAVLFALAFALIFDGRTPASAQQNAQVGAGYVSHKLEDPNWCWIHQYENPNNGKPFWDSVGGFDEHRPHKLSAREISDFSESGTKTTGKDDSGNFTITRRSKDPTGGTVYVFRMVRVPCPPDYEDYAGTNAGLSFTETIGLLTWIESLNGAQTNQGSARRDPLGVGVNIGYGFRPWNNNIVVNPFLSFDYQGWSVNYVFPNGSFIGAKSNYEGTAGVKIGPALPNGIWLYAIGGLSFLNETLTVNFIPVSSSTTKTVPGGTLGLGGAIKPSWMQVFGVPASLSLEWQHTWWQTANFNNPASSPAFVYAYKREDDKIKFGINFYLSR